MAESEPPSTDELVKKQLPLQASSNLENKSQEQHGAPELQDVLETHVISQPDDLDFLSGSDLRRKSLQGVLTEESRKLSGTSVKSMKSNKHITIVENPQKSILKISEAPKISVQSLKSTGSIAVTQDNAKNPETQENVEEDVTNGQEPGPDTTPEDPAPTTETQTADNSPAPTTGPSTAPEQTVTEAAGATKGAAKVLGGWMRKRFGKTAAKKVGGKKAGIAPRQGSQTRQKPT